MQTSGYAYKGGHILFGKISLLMEKCFNKGIAIVLRYGLRHAGENNTRRSINSGICHRALSVFICLALVAKVFSRISRTSTPTFIQLFLKFF